MECSKMESQEDSKESGVSFKSDRSQRYKILSSFRVRLESLQSAISCASAERDDSQGCTAHVKDTPPSPKEKPEDLTGADIDSVGDDEDLVESSYSLMAKGSMESIDSGVSFKSDWSKERPINFRHRSLPGRSDLSSYLMDNPVSYLKDWVDSSYSGMAMRSFEAFGSSLSSVNDSFIRNQQRSLHRMVLRSMDTFGSSLSLMSDSFIGTGQRSPPRDEMNQELLSEVRLEHR